MFLKYGDKTTPQTIEKTSSICEVCKDTIIKINSQKTCSCPSLEDKNTYNKSKKILTQENISTNFLENNEFKNV